jgi:nucleoside-diphosphate-sugar epimerase
MNTSLVTGASGFLGLALVRTLRAAGHPVRALIRPTTSSAARSALFNAGAACYTAEITDSEALADALVGVSHVFHLAGRLYIPGTPDHLYERTHIGGTQALIDACAQMPNLQRIVHCSTTGVVGPTGPLPASETAPIRPSTIYERTKAQAEQLALNAAAQGLPITVVRPALVYGSGDLHLLGWFRTIQRGIYRVVGSGDSLLHPIYISDLIDGMCRAATASTAVGRIYNLVGDHALPIRALAAAIAEALGTRLPRMHIPLSAAIIGAQILEALPGVPPARLPLTRSRIDFMTQSRVYNGERAQRELHFSPQIPLTEGLRRTVAWYREEGLL